MTIKKGYDKITFVAENGTENHRATSDKEEGAEADSPLERNSSKKRFISEDDKNL